jgi:hypothetical protein
MAASLRMSGGDADQFGHFGFTFHAGCARGPEGPRAHSQGRGGFAKKVIPGGFEVVRTNSALIRIRSISVTPVARPRARKAHGRTDGPRVDGEKLSDSTSGRGSSALPGLDPRSSPNPLRGLGSVY